MMPGTPLQSSLEEIRPVLDQFCVTGGACAVVSARAETGIRTSASVSKLEASPNKSTAEHARLLPDALTDSPAADCAMRPTRGLMSHLRCSAARPSHRDPWLYAPASRRV